MSLELMYMYQDVCPWNLHILTRTYVLGIYVCIYQDFCPWNFCILTRTYVLGIYVYLPGLMSLEFMYTYQDFCPWNLCILTRTSVLGIYVYIYRHIYLYIDIYVYNTYIYTLIHELILRFLYMAARTHVHTKDH